MRLKWKSVESECKDHQREIVNLRQKEARHDVHSGNRIGISQYVEDQKWKEEEDQKLKEEEDRKMKEVNQLHVETQVSTDLRNAKEKMPSPLIKVLSRETASLIGSPKEFQSAGVMITSTPMSHLSQGSLVTKNLPPPSSPIPHSSTAMNTVTSFDEHGSQYNLIGDIRGGCPQREHSQTSAKSYLHPCGNPNEQFYVQSRRDQSAYEENTSAHSNDQLGVQPRHDVMRAPAMEPRMEKMVLSYPCADTTRFMMCVDLRMTWLAEE